MPLTLFLRAEQRREVQLNWERVSDELQLQTSETRYIKSASPPQKLQTLRLSQFLLLAHFYDVSEGGYPYMTMSGTQHPRVSTETFKPCVYEGQPIRLRLVKGGRTKTAHFRQRMK